MSLKIQKVTFPYKSSKTNTKDKPTSYSAIRSKPTASTVL